MKVSFVIHCSVLFSQCNVSLTVAQVTKKLAGGDTGMATWITNVGNEYGQDAAEGDGLDNIMVD